MQRSRHHLYVGWRYFWRQIHRLIRNPVFAVLSLMGNFTLFSCAGLFYFLEFGTNPKVENFFDAIWWAVATMTTVGYGDIYPVTTAGRCVGIALMMTGGVLFLSFVGLLASVFMELELVQLESEVDELRTGIRKLSDDIHDQHSESLKD